MLPLNLLWILIEGKWWEKDTLSFFDSGFPEAAGGPLWETGYWTRLAFGLIYQGSSYVPSGTYGMSSLTWNYFLSGQTSLPSHKLQVVFMFAPGLWNATFFLDLQNFLYKTLNAMENMCWDLIRNEHGKCEHFNKTLLLWWRDILIPQSTRLVCSV